MIDLESENISQITFLTKVKCKKGFEFFIWKCILILNNNIRYIWVISNWILASFVSICILVTTNYICVFYPEHGDNFSTNLYHALNWFSLFKPI